jgi:hypothetical protein
VPCARASREPIASVQWTHVPGTHVLNLIQRHVGYESNANCALNNFRSNAELKLQGKHFWALWTKQGQEDLDGMVERYLQRPRR